ncbi:hypothetical protein [Peribacillus glennii]|uniref:hypothetical protein n=1 Tax=Peribacillus glennii TaxID=2303991 RepID=UPI0013141C4C|nr:hypothetical protein [Peribacillus glennii]
MEKQNNNQANNKNNQGNGDQETGVMNTLGQAINNIAENVKDAFTGNNGENNKQNNNNR